VLVLLVVCSCALVACSDDSDSSDADRDTIEVVDMRGQKSVMVVAKDNVFVPAGIRVDPGTKVTFVNEGRTTHNILLGDPDQAYDSSFGVQGEEFAPGESYSYTFEEPGVVPIYCSLHGTNTVGMVGVVVVGDVPFDGSLDIDAGTGTASGTLRVPGDYPTIQAAVDEAKPGSLVLVAPGVYKEAVTVSNPNIVIRGEKRTETILDGEFTRENGFKVVADGVAIENFTARNFTNNGFFWTGVKGYRGSYLSAIRNGDYGIYAFDSVDGQYDHAYGAGSPDAGFYIGQCYPCNAVITDSLAEWNGIGYSGTNSGGNLFIVNSVWRDNRVGIVPNSGTGELLYPERETTIVGNVVYGNSNAKTSAISIAETAIGNGILVAGGNDNLVERNRVYDHDLLGIGIITLPEKVLSPDNPKAIDFDARRNTVRDNVVEDSRLADLMVVTALNDAKDGGRNCFVGNEYTTSLPPDIQTLLECGSPASPVFEADIGRFAAEFTAEKPQGDDYKTIELPAPPPEALADMPDALNAPVRPANVNVPPQLDVSAITVPPSDS
jgi:plastocyanin